MKPYDYLVVGAGPFGSVFAYEAQKQGKRVLVIDKRDHVGGNMYCKEIEGIQVHWYGAHIFHTNNQAVWDYLNQFVSFNHYINSPIANYKGELFNLPFNMNTFSKLWGIRYPKEAHAIIAQQQAEHFVDEPKNLEEQALKLVGSDIYEKLIKGYTEKQWGRACTDLPAFIIRRLPVRFTFNNNYFNDRYQGIPLEGYNHLFDIWLKDVDVKLNADFFADRDHYEKIADKIIFTGMIDQFFDYQFGALDYRSLRFEHEILDEENYQGNAVVNFTDSETPYTRIIEHKHFAFGTQDKTVITKEYSKDWELGDEPYYPLNDLPNNQKLMKYQALAANMPNVVFGGRLGEYKYYDMHQVIENALKLVELELSI